ncbi:hypothetical protein FB45DRAFT_132070 [Roridomyces roridus]|uniref:F-box domain-containing protein n=1 Tax=Roridomyces roridus TaxID=1738132 RepID=A0AAD7BHE4_9AGAR|nr:hypothetical protein FB45DRAFT_132070 [Roridomyces roridus]
MADHTTCSYPPPAGNHCSIMNTGRCSQCGSFGATTTSEDFSVAPQSPRHRSLLTSNEVPLESDANFVKSVVSTIDIRLAKLDDQIQRLRDLLAPLEAERDSVAQYRAQNMGIISPLRRMPTEVLGQIFVWTLPTPNIAAQTYSLDDSPWLLTRVCSRWRAISIALPSLWSLIAISYHLPLIPYPPEMVKAHLSRASKKLFIFFFGSQGEETESQVEIFRLLCEQSPRWENVCLGMSSHMVPLLPDLRGRVGALSALQLTWTREAFINVDSVDCFETAPLRSVSISNGLRLVPTPFSTDYLTRYDLNETWSTHVDILKTAAHLVEARISIRSYPTDLDDSVIPLPHLQRLFITHPELLGHFDVPALQEIALELMEFENPDVFDPLTALILRCACAPRRLCIKGWPTTMIFDVLHQHTSFTTLAFELDDSRVFERCNEFISRLIIPDPVMDAAAMVAPRISEFLIACMEGVSIDHDLYLRMLESRWNHGSGTLQSAALLRAGIPTLLGPAPKAHILTGIEALRQEGLRHLLLAGSEALSVLDQWTYNDMGVDAPHPAMAEIL